MRLPSLSRHESNVLVLASHNQGKLRELEKLSEPHGLIVRSISDWTAVEPKETGTTFSENALIKARAAFQVSKLASLADDSGLEVEGLGGAPGVYSARWADADRNFAPAMKRVVNELSKRYGGFQAAPKDAYFVCVLALVTSPDREFLFEGRCNGHITDTPRGENGFGYDPIFIPDTATETFGEMPPARKTRFSHRNHAFNQFAEHIELCGLK
ncbi:MAG: RdgB/HAM1 family non-canonical purine NTP pyrophosphatase [Pseudomonadota bacterium]